MRHKTASVSTAKPDEGSLELTEELIRVRAYRFYEERGCEDSHASKIGSEQKPKYLETNLLLLKQRILKARAGRQQRKDGYYLLSSTSISWC